MAPKLDPSLTLIDPMKVYFTFSRIRPQFSCGRFVADTLRDVVDGKLHVEDLPPIAVLTDGSNLFSLNNRRLYVFKELCRLGLIRSVPARVRPVPQTKRMKEKYTVEKCALVARLKGLREAGDANDSASGNDDGEVDADDLEGPQPSAAAAPPRLEAATGGVTPTSSAASAAVEVQPKPTAALSRTAQKSAKREGKLSSQRGADAELSTLEQELARLKAHGGDDSDSDDVKPKKGKRR